MKLKDKIKELSNKGYSYSEISKTLGCSKGVISYHIGTKTRAKNKNTNVCSCGNKKDYEAKTCNKCFKQNNLNRQMERTLKDIRLSSNARIKWSSLRKLAHRYAEQEGLEKVCKICGFSVVVELCHIRPISSFSETALVSEVNSKDNLIYLCPNHHAMLDKELLTL